MIDHIKHTVTASAVGVTGYLGLYDLKVLLVPLGWLLAQIALVEWKKFRKVEDKQ